MSWTRILVSVALLLVLEGTAAAESRYVIHSGDQLAVQVFGDQTLSQTVTVLPGGEIFYPLAGRIHVADLTPDQAASAVAAALRKYVRDPVVNVSVLSIGMENVLVLGNVKNPGKYQIPAGSRSSDAIAAAGGLGVVDGPFPIARVEDSSGVITQVDLQKLLHDGDTSVDVRLENGSTVYVPALATFNVSVYGGVTHAGDVMLHEGDRLAMAVAKAGAEASLNPDLSHVHVTRSGVNGTQKYDINLLKELENGDITSDLVMQKGDVVFVPQTKKTLGQRLLSGVEGALLFLRSLVGL